MKVLRLAEVMKKTAMSRSMLYKLMREDKFPASIQISTRAVGWIDLEIDRWMENRLKNSKSIQAKMAGGVKVC